MNKADLLEKKLKSGVKVNKYIPRYGDRENTIAVFSRCACRYVSLCFTGITSDGVLG